MVHCSREYISFTRYISWKCSNPRCSSQGDFTPSTIETFVYLSSNHRSLCRRNSAAWLRDPFDISHTRRQGYLLSHLISSYVLGVIIFGVSLSTLTAISVDRLLALLLRLRYRQVVTLKRCRVVVAVLWLLHIFVGTMYFWVHFIFLWYGYVQITVCILISGFSYVKIYCTLRRQRAQIRNHGHQGQLYGWTQPNVAVYRKTVSSSLLIQLTLVACYLPYGIHTALIAKYGLSPSIILGGRFVSTFVYLNSTLNPFLYCWKIRGVRQAVKDTIRRLVRFL